MLTFGLPSPVPSSSRSSRWMGSCFLILFLCIKGVLCEERHIKNLEDLNNFTSSINNDGVTYAGDTVFLDTDLDFAGSSLNFEPIGTYERHFQGTFDGQGHVISNMKISSTNTYVGLFGYSNGTTIRNVVLDNSCSIVNFRTDSSGWKYTGGILGYCKTFNDACVVENSVNMADVSFTGIAFSTGSAAMYIGGIIGYFSYQNSNKISIRNCANYGSVTNSGSGTEKVYIGGIIGYCTGHSSSSKAYIQNCFNYGSVTNNIATATSLFIGGISGSSNNNTVTENCVSAGKVSSSKNTNAIGAIIGSGGTEGTSITHCFWTSDVGDNYDSLGSGGTQKITNTSKVSVNITTVDNLNGYAANKNWNKWLLNKDNKTITLKPNRASGSGFVVSSQLILLPVLTSEGKVFWWFTESELANQFTESEVTTATTLYGALGYVITFHGNGGDASQTSKFIEENQITYGAFPTMTANKTGYNFDGWFTLPSEEGTKVEPSTSFTQNSAKDLYAHWTAKQFTLTFKSGEETLKQETVDYNETIKYPENPTTKEGYTFSRWVPKPETMPAQDTTITARFAANNYTVTFDVNGGNALSETDRTKVVTFDSTYGELPEPNRIGHKFIGWFDNETNAIITKNTKVSITADNQTLVAQWTNKYALTFDYGNGTVVNKTLKYNETINYPVNITREGYIFNGWKPKSETMPANDTTVAAQWTGNTTIISIEISKKDLTKEEITEIIKGFTDENFVIERIEINNEKTTIIIRFNDVAGAQNFVDAIKNASSDFVIESINFLSEVLSSHSFRVQPPLFFLSLPLPLFFLTMRKTLNNIWQ